MASVSISSRRTPVDRRAMVRGLRETLVCTSSERLMPTAQSQGEARAVGQTRKSTSCSSGWDVAAQSPAEWLCLCRRHTLATSHAGDSHAGDSHAGWAASLPATCLHDRAGGATTMSSSSMGHIGTCTCLGALKPSSPLEPARAPARTRSSCASTRARRASHAAT